MIAEEVSTSWAQCLLNVRNGEMSQRFYQWVYFGRSLLEDGWKNQAPVSSARKKFLIQRNCKYPEVAVSV